MIVFFTSRLVRLISFQGCRVSTPTDAASIVAFQSEGKHAFAFTVILTVTVTVTRLLISEIICGVGPTLCQARFNLTQLAC